MSSTVLLLSPLRQASGNHSTIKRIRSHLESEFIICKEWDPADFDDEEQFLRKLRENNIDFVIALHAYKAGKYLSTKVPIPYILIFGGTDINQLHTDEDKLCKMSRAVEGARNIVAFSQEMMDKALQIWPDLVKSRASIIKQGIQTRPSALSLREVLVKHGHVSSAVITGATIFLFVGSIRPVKDPLYLINTMTEWHKERTDILYVIIGPEYGEDYFAVFNGAIHGAKGVIYLGEMSIENAHACMRDSSSLVNTSESEGMAAVVLEAMDLGTPVIARRNGGNEALIQHGVTGFLFSSPEEFKEIAESFSEDAVMQRKITIAAKEQIRREHLPEIEKNAYYKVMNGLKH
ncbi:glycosyltransferase 1 domain-containing protein 1-like isoform X1 [Ostrea edulis]|uniref:glycosyltransferase 1 domain-containing protein 1-like isoform X1 n=1 Tax=Ostrea edulis TaxID=37623 RepID=UPI0024AEF6BB|nr:glycosyltransferase 1 domain-containing protein 1-like isoform X1 [Ostrea edulis]